MSAKPLLPATAKELLAIYEQLDENTLLWAVRMLPYYQKNLLVPCKQCGADEGEGCRGRGTEKKVHGGRYYDRLESIGGEPVDDLVRKLADIWGKKHESESSVEAPLADEAARMRK